MFEEIKKKLNNVTLNGGNLGLTNITSFDLISKRFDFESENDKKIIEYWEKFYFNLYNKLLNNEIPVNQLDVEEGIVIIKPGYLFHRLSSRMESLINISIGGLLASEWFNFLESESEAYLCTFLDTVQDELPQKEFGPYPTEEERDYIKKYIASIQNRKAAFSLRSGGVSLFFDINNPIMQMLMKFDFFEYLKIRKMYPEKLKEIYPEKLIILYEEICGAEGMQFSSNFHDEKNYTRKTWLAIPFGIPPQLINGICINSQEKLDIMEHLDEISNMFPNAVIFNENREVIRYSLVTRDTVSK